MIKHIQFSIIRLQEKSPTKNDANEFNEILWFWPSGNVAVHDWDDIDFFYNKPVAWAPLADLSIFAKKALSKENQLLCSLEKLLNYVEDNVEGCLESQEVQQAYDIIELVKKNKEVKV